MTKLVRKSRRPCEQWIGKRLAARQDMSVPVLSGAEDAVVEVLNGQELEVIEVQEDGWLRCRPRHDMFYRGDGLQRVHSADLIVGVHTEHDLDKFRVQRSRLREDAHQVIIAAAQGWLSAKRELDAFVPELVQMSAASPEMDRRVKSVVLELREMRDRMDRAHLALQQRIALYGEPEWFPKALDLLQRLNRDFSMKAMSLKQEIQRYWHKGPREQIELVQTYSWTTSFIRRLRSWLKRAEKKITELEGLVFYS